jgi:hypothetical protein
MNSPRATKKAPVTAKAYRGSLKRTLGLGDGGLEPFAWRGGRADMIALMMTSKARIR